MKNVIFAGVGGQGVILASKILMEVAMNAGYDVKESEVHGMAQRGRERGLQRPLRREGVFPAHRKGDGGFRGGLEILEAMRKLEYLKTGGMLIVNRDKIDPAPVQAGMEKYPGDIEEWIRTNVKNSMVVDTEATLKESGSKKALNIVMLGVLSNFLEFSPDQWNQAIRASVKEKFLDMNIRAFQLGKGLGK